MVSGRNWTRTRVDMRHDVGHTSNLSLSWDKRGIRAKKSPFLGFDLEREEKRERGEPSFLPRSTEFRGLIFVRLRAKVHRINKRYMWVP